MPRPGAIATECVVRLDRVVFTSRANLQSALQALADFRTESDHGLRNVEEGVFSAPYARVRNLIDDQSKTKVFVHYRPRFRRLPLIRVTVVPDDLKGQNRQELERILRAFEPFELVIVEHAIDFPRRKR